MKEVPADGPVLIHRVIARLNVGGPAMHVVNLARAMNGGEWRTRLLAGSVSPTEGDMGYYAAEHGVDVTYLPEMAREISPIADARTLWALYRLFRTERPRVVHTHTAKAGTLGRLAAILAGVPVRVHTYHGHVLGGDYFGRLKTGTFRLIERVLGRRTSRLVVLTERQAREMSDDLGVAPRERFAVVPLGLELDAFASVDRETARRAARASLGIGAGELALGIVGRLVPIKNHELFFDVVVELARRDVPVRAVVIGSGEREQELRARASALGLEHEVLWLGWRRDLAELYPALDALALTSHDEGTPVAVIEALAAGTPVVARDVGGVSEVVQGVPGAHLMPSGAGAEVWADRVIAASTSPGPSLEARRATADRYSVARLVRDLEAVYREAAGR